MFIFLYFSYCLMLVASIPIVILLWWYFATYAKIKRRREDKEYFEGGGYEADCKRLYAEHHPEEATAKL